MQKALFTLFLSLVFVGAFAQIKDPVSWDYKVVNKSASTYELVITATVQKPWHIYSQNTEKGGPIATTIQFKKNPLLSVVGKPKEIGKLEKVFDDNFKVNVLYYGDKVVFSQNITVRGNVKTNVSGTIQYMVCDDTQCLPPTTKSFDIKLQ